MRRLEFLAIFIFIVLSINIVSAKLIVQESHPLTINTWDTEFVKQNKDYIFVWDASQEGSLLLNNQTNCTFFLIQSGTTNQITSGIANRTPDAYGWFKSIDGSKLNVTTIYHYQIDCFLLTNTSVSGNLLGSFQVTPTGFGIENTDTYLFILGVFVLIFITIFFFVLSYLMSSPGTKLFFMGLTVLNFIILIGLVVSTNSYFLWKFVDYNSVYDKYYILLTIGGTVVGIGLVVWLIYYAMTLFNKTRGIIEDED